MSRDPTEPVDGPAAAPDGAAGCHVAPSRPTLARLIDHTLLRPEATAAEVAAHAREGRALGVAAVCVHGAFTPLVRAQLAGSAVRTCTVVGFPHGAMARAAKAAEARLAVADGAEELDMVMALGAALAGDWDRVQDDVAGVVEAASGVPVKVIVEAALLDPEALGRACLAAEAAGAAWVKTSTGFHAAGGAREEDVRRMRRAVGGRLGVKASGGIRSYAMACAMLAAGATRLGTSGTAAILAAAPA